MRKDSNFYKLIEKICKEKGIAMRDASFGYITELKKNGIVRHIVGETLELNTSSAYKIASDKFACFSILVQNEVPTIKYNMIFNPETRSDYENNDILKAMILFDQYNGKVILKANTSSEGKDVFCITNKEELKKKIIEEFASNKDSLSICPFYDIGYEYRAIYLDGEIIFCYKKEKPYVIGNGEYSLKKLVQNLEIENVYENLDLNYIPKKGEKVEVSWKHNLCLGGVPNLDIDEETRKRVYDLAKKAGNAIGIKFASVDIAETKDKELLVMEINSNVCMNKFAETVANGLQIEYEIFSNAIDKMFEA